VHGVAQIGFAHGGQGTRLASLYQQAPLRVLFPHPPAGDPPHAVLVTTSGGLVGGDRLEVEIATAPNAMALVTTQAAEKVYRSTGASANLEVTLRVGPGAWLEWCPQETILFEGARLRRSTTLQLEPGARVLAGEILVFGRRAHGEQLRTGSLRDSWRVHLGDRLVWTDALRLEGNVAAQLAAPFGFAGAAASATLIYAGTDAAAWLATMRDLVAGDHAGQRCGVTRLPGLLLCRWLDQDAARLRACFMSAWTGFRHAGADLSATVPVTWNC
jgi:urease accessory protein